MMRRVEEAPDLFLVAAQPRSQLGFGEPRLQQRQVEGSLGGSERGNRNDGLPRFCLRGLRNQVTPPDAAGDGFFQSIGRLGERADVIVTLGDRLRHVLKSDHEPSIDLVGSQGYGISELEMHRDLLVAEILKAQSELPQHRVQRAGLELILEIPDHRKAGSKIERRVTALASLGPKLDA